MHFPFFISELKKSLPGAENLGSLSWDDLLSGLRRASGDAAKDSEVTVDGEITPNPISGACSVEAAPPHERAVTPARQGEFEKAAGSYRRVLELDPTRQDSRRELAMVLVELGNTSAAVDVLLDVLKGKPRALCFNLGSLFGSLKHQGIPKSRVKERIQKLEEKSTFE